MRVSLEFECGLSANMDREVCLALDGIESSLPVYFFACAGKGSVADAIKPTGLLIAAGKLLINPLGFKPARERNCAMWPELKDLVYLAD